MPFDRKQHRVNLRVAELDKLVPNRICPKCGRGPLLSLKSWVIYVCTNVDHAVMCRSCWWKRKENVE